MGLFAKKEIFFVSGSGFPAEADVGARRLNLNRVGRSRGIRDSCLSCSFSGCCLHPLLKAREVCYHRSRWIRMSDWFILSNIVEHEQA